jgi:ribosome biogenesis GTPase
MLDPDFRISVGDVSKKLNRGRHTTRHVELFDLPCGAVVADTPGFSAFDTGRIAAKEELQFLFRDFESLTGNCRFLDCAHIREPGCVVLAALEEGRIMKTRHASYVRLYEQALKSKDWEYKSARKE